MDSHTDAPAPQSWLTSSTDWVSHAASEAWSATAGTARVAGELGKGFATQVYEHPGLTLVEVGAAALVAGAAAEAGIGLAGAAAIAAVPAAGYGLYRGAQIAATEGVGAIPAHMAQTYDEAKAFVSSSADAVASVYHGNGQSGDLAQAQATVQHLGGMAVPLVAGGIGGAGGELGSAAIVGGGKALSSLLESTIPVPELAYAGGVPGAMGAGTGGAVESTAVGAATATTGAAATHSMEMPSAAGGGARAEAPAAGVARDDMGRRLDTPSARGGERGEAPATGVARDEFGRQQEFVEGRPAAAVPEVPAETSGVLRGLRNVFSNADKILAGGGRAGNIELSKGADGWLTAHFVDGPMKGTTGIYEPGTNTFLVERGEDYANSHSFPMK